MIDLILIVAGVIALTTGLWMFSPALSLVVVGAGMLVYAYGRYRVAQPSEIASKQTT